ncbi:hypothetical protein LIER_29585 [Lithospermum erythrorhizon]|uniref:Uncharacterized protein n=1 Tax=Lithospermum erythrorhizon TaxID=34254 RepID=A0AAV3RPU1_LITER
MASAALATQNESSWAQSGGGGGGGGGGYMGKIPSSAYMNPNPKKKQKQFHNNHQQFHPLNGHDEAGTGAVYVTQTASDDAYSFNQRSNFEGFNGGARNGFNVGGCLTFNLASYKKSELVDLRKKLVAELDQVRSLRDRIDSGQFSSTNNTQNPRVKGGKNSKNSKKLPVNKRPIPFGSTKDLKKLSNGVENRSVSLAGMANIEGLMKECRSILTKLMKHKDGWVFNVPVDDVALGLHDYHQIVKRPMDLGTVKSNFAKKLYTSPVEFADDVRLTFNNALLYNPKNDPVHVMAEGLLVRFEELFKPIQDKIDGFRGVFRGGDEVVRVPTPERVKKTKANPAAPPIVPPRTTSMKKLDRVQSQSHSSASTPSHPPPPPLEPPPSMQPNSPVQTPSPPSKSHVPSGKAYTATGKASMAKLPKPRAKDPNKREMNIEEKHKLGLGLQSLPQEKMPQLVQIIRKRNEHLAQDGDEIELDIEALDTETLWELDRFVTNWKKMVSKTKRQALLMNLNPGNAAAPSTSAADTDAGPELSDRNESEKKPKKGDDLDDDDVDIEDDMPVTSFPPVEIEKDEAGGGGAGGPEENGNAGSDSSSSSSSGSGSSSSSDSDSGSSSGSDSDEDEAQS